MTVILIRNKLKLRQKPQIACQMTDVFSVNLLDNQNCICYLLEIETNIFLTYILIGRFYFNKCKLKL